MLQTSFVFALRPPTSSKSVHDKDGDLVLQRKRKLTIMHRGATCINDVGMQLWPASILLVDYVINQLADELKGCLIELGSGCGGIPSLIASLISPSLPIFVTDAHFESLECLEANLKSNNIGQTVKVRKLDWMIDDVDSLASPTARTGLFEWTPSDMQELESEDGIILLSADCIYDETLTEAMLDTAYCLMRTCRGQSVLFVAMEKRYTFTLRDLDSRAPAYEHFISLLHIEGQEDQDLKGTGREEEKKRMKGRRIDAGSIPESVHVSPVHSPRSLDLLELWRIVLINQG